MPCLKWIRDCARGVAWRRGSAALLAALLLLACGGCPTESPSHDKTGLAEPAKLLAADLGDLSETTAAATDAISIAGARNESIDFAVQVNLPNAGGYALRLAWGATGRSLPVEALRASQVLPVPLALQRAAWVRETGQSAASRTLPRALLPLATDAAGRVDLSKLRNAASPADPRSHAGGPGAPPALVYFDLHLPRSTAPGEYAANIELVAPESAGVVASLPLSIRVADFEIPDERHLVILGTAPWQRLEALYPSVFETATPQWLNRRDQRYRPAMHLLDQLVGLGQENRVNVYVPELRPIVKWPAGEGPAVDWRDFDSTVLPWLSGKGSGEGVGRGFWPLPRAEMLDRYDLSSRVAYWIDAAGHFEKAGWIDRSAAPVGQPGASALPSDAADLCAEAQAVLAGNSRIRVLLPLQDGQVQLADGATPGIARAQLGRALVQSAPLVSTEPLRRWGEQSPRHWLSAAPVGGAPSFGAGGSEKDALVWAWLAYLRHLDSFGVSHVFEQNLVVCDSTLPRTNSLEQPADPGDLVWFYPGEWFNADAPLATLQLKWLRRAQQDYEYLVLAQERGEPITALQLARLLTKPVELQPGQSADPVYSLLSGSSDARTWSASRRLIADTIVLHKPDAPVDEAQERELQIRALELCEPQEHPLLINRGARWRWSGANARRPDAGAWVDLDLEMDIYNASETRPDQNRLRWAQLPAGWEVKASELVAPRLLPYHVLPITVHQRLNLTRLVPGDDDLLALQFINGYNQSSTTLRVALPVAPSEWRDGPLKIDGDLADWSAADRFHQGPLVNLFNRPALQRQELGRSTYPAALFSSWARENFYFAFALEGLSARGQNSQNFVNYEDRRAWGEDLCEILLQPIDALGNAGAATHIVCKPFGGIWVERKTTDGGNDGGWRALESAEVRYAASTPGQTWRGELAIPWSAIVAPGAQAPRLLRFNFVQHLASTGQSASWAGPIDYGRDDAFTGLLYLNGPPQTAPN